MDHRPSIESNLQAFPSAPLRQASLDLLATLGYRSDKTVNLEGSKPKAFLDFIAKHNPDAGFDPKKALVADWKSADILFQLTDEEISRENSLFEDTSFKPGLLKSYLFFAIELTGDSTPNGSYARGKLTAITRQINRVFPMPVMLLIKHPENGTDVLSIAVINRRANKRDTHKDVLGKVTIIRDISLTEPHRGHLDILESFSVEALASKKRPIYSFDALHAAWEEVFNVELLNKKFYRELSNWYFWAMRHCHFPLLDETADKYFLFKDREKVREHEAKNLIRLLTRILFVWFIKQKGLVPDDFFDADALRADFLENFDPETTDTRYYKAVLQNLFFASLNQTHGKREFRKSGQHHNTTTLLRYESRLKDPQKFIEAVEAVTPFLNGGLFDCLDYPHSTKKGPQGGAVTIYEDGFSDRKDNPLTVPDFLFFGARQDGVDLSPEYGDPKKKNESVRGLIHILDAYKFTIVENTPIEQEIALDPELLGQVFENLLASYNEETKTTARKQTGSFYTPRPIVDYMVDESLKAHLTQALVNEADMPEADAKEGLDILFAYREKEHAFTEREKDVLIRAIDSCKILDPACGSGAFPMGALQKLVYILGKLDPRDELWEKRQLAKVDKLIEAAQDFDDASFRDRAIADAEAQRKDIEEAFANNELGYGRKLYLIENCLYGVDIQSIATQVSKLRFFISLIVDQTVDKARDNFGIRPLPNLETKFVTADTLIQIEKPQAQGELFEIAEVSKLQKQLKQVRHDLFSAKTPRTKRKHRERDEELRAAIAEELKQNGWASDAADKLAAWDPYDQNASAPYFDPEWMFGLTGFDIVIGNPPYISVEKFTGTKQQQIWRNSYETFSARGDIYCFFYERGLALLRQGGVLGFITSNKFQKAGYGKKLRQLLASQYVHTIIDFCELPVFAAATDPLIIVCAKQPPPSTYDFPVLIVKDQSEFGDLTNLLESRSARFKPEQLKQECWSLKIGNDGSVVDKMRAIGKPLNEYVDGKLYLGLRTGLNEAFVIDAETRKRLINEDEKSEELIKPWIRGRDITRWQCVVNELYVITIHHGFHARLNEYSAIRRHLDKFEGKLKARGQCKNSRSGSGTGQHHWLELDNNPSAEFLKLFTSPSVVYADIGKHLKAFFNTEGIYFGNTAYFIPESEPWLAALLLSRPMDFYYRHNMQPLGDPWTTGRMRFFSRSMNLVPIPPVNHADRIKLTGLAEHAAEAVKIDGSDAINAVEQEIDQIVYRLFDLTADEIAQVNKALSNTKGSPFSYDC